MTIVVVARSENNNDKDGDAKWLLFYQKLKILCDDFVCPKRAAHVMKYIVVKLVFPILISINRAILCVMCIYKLDFL